MTCIECENADAVLEAKYCSVDCKIAHVRDAETQARRLFMRASAKPPKPTVREQLQAQVTRAVARGGLQTPEAYALAQEIVKLTLAAMPKPFRRPKRLLMKPEELRAYGAAVRKAHPEWFKEAK